MCCSSNRAVGMDSNSGSRPKSSEWDNDVTN